MPFDSASHAIAPVDAAELHGVPRALLVRRALEAIAPSLRAAVAEIELAEAPPMVNLGLNLDRVAWRAVWRRPGLPEASGTIPVWRGEIAA